MTTFSADMRMMHEPIFNLTQHDPTDSQLAAGLVKRDSITTGMVRELLTFKEPPSRDCILNRADALAKIAKDSGCKRILIGGAGYLMGPLEKELRFRRLIPVHSFSERASVEKEVDGKVATVSEFIHLEWVESAII